MQQALTTQQPSQEDEADCLLRKWQGLLFCSCFRRDTTTGEGNGHTSISNSIQTQQLNFYCDSSTQFLAFIASMETFVLFSLLPRKGGNYRISASSPPS